MEIDEEPTDCSAKDIKRVGRDTGEFEVSGSFERSNFPPIFSSQNLLIASHLEPCRGRQRAR